MAFRRAAGALAGVTRRAGAPSSVAPAQGANGTPSTLLPSQVQQRAWFAAQAAPAAAQVTEGRVTQVRNVGCRGRCCRGMTLAFSCGVGVCAELR